MTSARRFWAGVLASDAGRVNHRRTRLQSGQAY
jgi:hypothetical protein